MIRNLILGAVLLAGLSACQKEKAGEEATDATTAAAAPTAVNEMPMLSVDGIDGNKISFHNHEGKVLIICFNPDCDHCQREAKLLSENKDLFKDYQVYFISPESIEMITQFSKDYNLVEPNVHFARADINQVLNSLGNISTVPTFFVYKDQKRTARVEGELTVPKLHEILD